MLSLQELQYNPNETKEDAISKMLPHVGVSFSYQRWLASNHYGRWLIVVAGVLINLALGVRHAWSVFGSPLAATYKWDSLTVTWPLILSTIVFALLMIPAGRWNDRWGPRPVGLAGGVLASAGFVLSSLAPHDPSEAGVAWIWIMLAYGVLTGVGSGLGYAVPVATALRWFPDQRGLVTGLAVLGFGLSAALFGPLANTMIMESGVWTTFYQLGIAFLIMIVVGSLLLTNPPAGWHPAGWKATAVSAASNHTRHHYSPGQLLRMKQTYLLILMYAFSTAAGLMVISFAKSFLDSFQFDDLAAVQGLNWLNALPIIGFNLFTGKPAELSAVLVGWLAVWNALGRMIIGWISDAIGRHKTMALNFVLTAMSVSLMPLFAASAWLTLLLYLIIGVTFGGTLTLFPATNADWFGTTHVGVNYGIIFLGWGVGGVIGPLVGNFGVGMLGGYQAGFIFAAILGLMATLMARAIQAPTAHLQVQPAPVADD